MTTVQEIIDRYVRQGMMRPQAIEKVEAILHTKLPSIITDQPAGNPKLAVGLKRMFPCKRPDCGGQVMLGTDGSWICNLCSRPYTSDGELENPQDNNYLRRTTKRAVR